LNIKKTEDLAVGDMQGALLERQALPIGRSQFTEWSDRIIKAACVEASERSLKFSLASMIMHLGPTEAFKEDAYFVLALRKAASTQTAHMMLQEIKEEQEREKKQAEATAPNLQVVDGGRVLENQDI
jgi:hypothetical protein